MGYLAFVQYVCAYNLVMGTPAPPLATQKIGQLSKYSLSYCAKLVNVFFRRLLETFIPFSTLWFCVTVFLIYVLCIRLNLSLLT